MYMQQPEGFVVEGRECLVCRSKHSIYGLKQSLRCWNSTIDGYLKKLGFLQLVSDPCIYIAAVGELAVVGVYVNGINYNIRHLCTIVTARHARHARHAHVLLVTSGLSLYELPAFFSPVLFTPFFIVHRHPDGS